MTIDSQPDLLLDCLEVEEGKKKVLSEKRDDHVVSSVSEDGLCP